MIADGFTNLYVDPTQFIWPSVMLGTLTASLVLLGNSLRDAFEGAKLKPSKASAPRAITPTRDSIHGSAADLLSVDDLAIAYPTPAGQLRDVVKGVSLKLRAGETLGLVGESGSG
ncbi:hypothetical protein [Arthrobacter sp. StoSoilB5]|nr:hypothetical protein [Arthrobacter sp. StoSoilB5]BCW44755.1 hypothetical protein StoSoilB5_19390 [Arthrobacter sp. StoSoilB5]